LEAGAEGLEPFLVAAHPVGGAVDREDDAAVEEAVEDGAATVGSSKISPMGCTNSVGGRAYWRPCL